MERARGGSDASEADLAVLQRQRATFEAIDPEERLHLIEADTTRATIREEVASSLSAVGVTLELSARVRRD